MLTSAQSSRPPIAPVKLDRSAARRSLTGATPSSGWPRLRPLVGQAPTLTRQPRTSRKGSGRTRRPLGGRSERSGPRPTFCGRSANSPAWNTLPPDAACGVRWKGVLSCRTAQSVLSAYRRLWYNCDCCIPNCPTVLPPGPKSSPTGTCAAHWRRRSYRPRWHRSLNLPRHSWRKSVAPFASSKSIASPSGLH